MDHFERYSCRIAFDPEEWPGEWEQVLLEFPPLTASAMVSSDHSNYAELLEYLDHLVHRGMRMPNGGVVFVDVDDRVFKTNWELRECWDWWHILRRTEHERHILHCFDLTAATMEVARVPEGVMLQHLDYEHPCGLAGSRRDLPGILLADASRFRSEVSGLLDSLRRFYAAAVKAAKSDHVALLFGEPKAAGRQM